MPDTTGQVPAIPDELVDIIATALAQWDFEYAASHSIAGYRRWDELVGEYQEHYRGAARSALAALDAASRVVVDLPKPDWDRGDRWTVQVDDVDYEVTAHQDHGTPCVVLAPAGDPDEAVMVHINDSARQMAVAYLAALDLAEQKADAFNAARQDAEDQLDEQERLRSRVADRGDG